MPYRLLQEPYALPVVIEVFVPYQTSQEPLCLIGYCRCLRALPDIVGAFVPYRILQEPSCPTGYYRSLVPYWLTISALRFNGLFQIKYYRLCCMFEVFVFQILCLLTELFNSLFSYLLYRYRSNKTLDYPTGLGHERPSVSSVHF